MLNIERAWVAREGMTEHQKFVFYAHLLGSLAMNVTIEEMDRCVEAARRYVIANYPQGGVNA